jgi:hypothetical protein
MRIEGRKIFYWLTGGRPMKHVGYAFTDKVTGREVHYFRDDIGLNWMAEHAWAFFRVPV